MLSAVGAALVGTALVAGATGTWSPCGFSMIESLGAARRSGRSALVAVSVTFALGALGGGAATFGLLAELGAALGAPNRAGVVAAAVIAAAAAAGEARGIRILPQIRRQVPEPWRRTLPLPLAAGLYGILLGLGFTTFVLTFAVWALAAICVALGEPWLGVAVGIAFGAGRAAPLLALAPLAETSRGPAALAVLAERPQLLRRARVAAGAALGLSALALAASAASAAPIAVVAAPATDPSAAGGDLAWEQPGKGAILRRGSAITVLEGHDPAIGGALVAWHNGALVTVARRADFAPVFQQPIPGVQKLAVSDRWLVYRRGRRGGGYELAALLLADPKVTRRIMAVASPAQIGRPVIGDDVVVFHVATREGSTITAFNLATRKRGVLRQARREQLLNPAVEGNSLLYVRVSRCRQELRIGPLRGGRERVLRSLAATAVVDRGSEPGHTHQGAQKDLCPEKGGTSVLWTTALTSRYVYLAQFRLRRGAAVDPKLIQLKR